MVLCREPTIPELERLTGLTAAMLQRSEAARKLQETQLDVLIDSSSGSGQDRGMDKVEMIADTSEAPDQVGQGIARSCSTSACSLLVFW